MENDGLIKLETIKESQDGESKSVLFSDEWRTDLIERFSLICHEVGKSASQNTEKALIDFAKSLPKAIALTKKKNDLDFPDYLFEIKYYLPINDLEVNDYISRIFDTIRVSHTYNEYQMAYFNTYFLFMVYLYGCVWKISQVYKDKFSELAVFLKAYDGKDKRNNKRIDFCNVESIFDFCRIPDKQIIKILVLTGMDKSYISGIESAINYRNDMAHATNELSFIDENTFNRLISDLLSHFKNINLAMKCLIHKWYIQLLMDCMQEKYTEEYGDFIQVIKAKIEDFSISTYEFNSCKEFGLQKYIGTNKELLTTEQIVKLKAMHKIVRDYIFDD